MGHSSSKPSSRITAEEPTSAIPDIRWGRSFPKYTYAALAHPRQFRILRLKCPLHGKLVRWQDIVLSGNIVVASLDNVPEYFALSYTWGDSSISDNIEIDGMVLGITQNCAAALRRMVRGKFERMIWVDSICINQASNAQAVEERGKQVAMMDEIYSKAIQVNVHLGPGNGKTDESIIAARKLAKAAEAALLAKKSGAAKQVTKMQYDKIAEEVLAITPEYPYGKLHSLFSLPWFTRVWVFQEVVLAQKVTFYCGEYKLAFEVMVLASDFTLVPYSKSDAGANHWYFYLDRYKTYIDYLRETEQGQSTEIGARELLGIACDLEATRAEDKVYGMFGCATRLGLEWPVPDYKKSVAQVYTEATINCLRQADSLDVLQDVEGTAAKEFEMPSWVLNLSGCTSRFGPSNPPRTCLVLEDDKRVSGLTQYKWKLKPGGKQLKIRGRRMDLVATTGDPWQVDSATGLLGGASHNTGQGFDSLLDCINTWLEVGLHRPATHGISTETGNALVAVSNLARLFTKANTTSLKVPDRFEEGLSVLIGHATGIDADLRGQLLHPQNDLAKLVQTDHIPPEVVQTFNYMFCFMWKRVFRTAKTAYLGIGSYSAKPGDLIVVFHGMKTPCLIRSCEEGFNFVSAAFVDGIMDGSFWDAGSDADDEWFVLI